MSIRVGATKEEVLEVIIQMIAYAGFPYATNALYAVADGIGDWEAEKSHAPTD